MQSYSPDDISGVGVKQMEWWEALTPGEKKLICNLMRMLRGAKHSQIQEVARAAAKWERGIGCFIKVFLISASARGTTLAKTPSRKNPNHFVPVSLAYRRSRFIDRSSTNFVFIKCFFCSEIFFT